MSPRRRTALVALVAVLGIVLAAAITYGTSQLVRQHIGLASEPITAGRNLLAPVTSVHVHTSRPATVPRSTRPRATPPAATTPSVAAPVTPSVSESSPPAAATGEAPRSTSGAPAAGESPTPGATTRSDRQGSPEGGGEGGDKQHHADD